ncbi:TetR-like C-terminal domain-containing protein [Streptomyces calidiresistens]|uniref:TetR family transcriptional regulator n=1 Tax=Streptomyces calidiresistens TaxID=1485586 RepID=A0A7W3T8H6_9ACTN|nr:TetR-like C-terminal domain-containing protein [Streptomyces calidiresistens]MBB0232849.1 TetR family transcriptional regulator [Streptomyces calidiresistens]
MPRVGLTAAGLTEAAAKMADEVGLDGVSLSALARRFGVRDASLYSHVRNLRELRVRVALLAAAELADRISAAIAGRAGHDALAAFADAYLGYAIDHPGRYAATHLRLDPEEVAATGVDPSGPRRGAELTYAVLRAHGLAEPDLTDAARLLRATLHGWAHLERTDAFSHPRDLRESRTRSIEALHSLLGNWPARSEPARTDRSDSEGNPRP